MSALGWTNGTCHCKIEKYIDDDTGFTRHRINLGDGIKVIGFNSYEDAVKFIYKLGWALE